MTKRVIFYIAGGSGLSFALPAGGYLIHEEINPTVYKKFKEKWKLIKAEGEKINMAEVDANIKNGECFKRFFPGIQYETKPEPTGLQHIENQEEVKEIPEGEIEKGNSIGCATIKFTKSTNTDKQGGWGNWELILKSKDKGLNISGFATVKNSNSWVVDWWLMQLEKEENNWKIKKGYRWEEKDVEYSGLWGDWKTKNSSNFCIQDESCTFENMVWSGIWKEVENKEEGFFNLIKGSSLEKKAEVPVKHIYKSNWETIKGTDDSTTETKNIKISEHIDIKGEWIDLKNYCEKFKYSRAKDVDLEQIKDFCLA